MPEQYHYPRKRVKLNWRKARRFRLNYLGQSADVAPLLFVQLQCFTLAVKKAFHLATARSKTPIPLLLYTVPGIAPKAFCSFDLNSQL
jgi:hypothetical protein